MVWLVDTTSMTVKAQPVMLAGAGNDAVVTGGLSPEQVVVCRRHVLNQTRRSSCTSIPRLTSATAAAMASTAMTLK